MKFNGISPWNQTVFQGSPVDCNQDCCQPDFSFYHFNLKMNSRKKDFEAIKKMVEPELLFSDKDVLVAKADSLSLLKKIPSHSVSLILTDPPYHATKKHNIYGDRAFEQDKHYVEWMSEFASEWRRILRLNGSLFCCCDSSMSARLDVAFSKSFNVLSHIVWTKPNEPGFDGWKGKMKKTSLRQWYPHSERILFAEPAVEGNLFRSPFALFLKNARLQAEMTMKDLTGLIGAFGKVNHGGAVANWEDGRNTPSREQYEKMRDVLMKTGKVDPMPPYEDVIRPFIMDGSKEFTDVWNFPSVRPYKGKHPAEKPLSLLEHAIEATTFAGDIVLDCFAGGGNTALAALKLKRRAIVIEIEEKWADSIALKVSNFLNNQTVDVADNGHTPKRINRLKNNQLALFTADR